MATQWKFKRGDEEFGPFTSGQLKQLAAGGKLTPDDLVWKDGLPDWVSAQRVKGLFEVDAQNAAAALSGINLGAQVESTSAGASSKGSTPTSDRPVPDQQSQVPSEGTEPENADAAH
jgi:hypothetical protein